MARLSIEKQEKFATYIAAGYTQMSAYKEAGYACKNSTAAANASKLMSEPTVAARVEELKIKAAEKGAMDTAPPLPLKKVEDAAVSLEWINNEYIAFLNIAREEKDLKNAAILLKDMADINKVRPEPEEKTTNRMLPTNDKSNLGSQTFISIINQKSENNGGSIDGLVPINLPETSSEPVHISYNGVDED